MLGSATMAGLLSVFAADAWFWAKAADPAWVNAVAATIGVVVGVRVGLSLVAAAAGPAGQRAAAIIALLGENDLEGFPDLRSDGHCRDLIGHSSDVVYFKIGSDSYLLCRRDLDRLHAMGYGMRLEKRRHELRFCGRTGCRGSRGFPDRARRLRPLPPESLRSPGSCAEPSSCPQRRRSGCSTRRRATACHGACT